MPKFKPIKQSRVSEEVAEQLKQSILSGEFGPGDKLPSERELMEEFQVSRVAVREALRFIEKSGFIETRQGANGGAFIIELSFENLAHSFLDLFLADKISIPELCDVRLLIEPEVARLAAINITDEYRKRLNDILELEETPVKSLADDIEIKTQAHGLLAEICGNRFLEALVKSLMRVTRKVIEEVNPNTLSMHPAGMHRPIVEAVICGDSDEAARAMREHAIEFGHIMIEMEKTYRQELGRHNPQKQDS